MDCCAAKGCDEFFNERFARWLARRYRRRGLDKTARRMVGFLEERGISGRTVLEIGGGIGEIQLELLRAGAERTVNLELSPNYESIARELLREAGFEDRVERRLVDIAEQPAEVAPADAVVMHRVVCCYPDMPKLVGAAADHARRHLARIGERAFRSVERLFRSRDVRLAFGFDDHGPSSIGVNHVGLAIDEPCSRRSGRRRSLRTAMRSRPGLCKRGLIHACDEHSREEAAVHRPLDRLAAIPD
jgi:hypothetical protein